MCVCVCHDLTRFGSRRPLTRARHATTAQGILARLAIISVYSNLIFVGDEEGKKRRQCGGSGKNLLQARAAFI